MILQKNVASFVLLKLAGLLHDYFSVTRFGEMSPLWQYFKSLGQVFKSLFSVWQNFEPAGCPGLVENKRKEAGVADLKKIEPALEII